jgi:pimeloyl-ACP methyl ester carboxylesterase
VSVPLDYARPAGRRIDIAISRVRAADPGKRRGVLLMNPGGPGSSGLNMPVTKQLPEEVTQQYDLVGFDPRGVGASTPVTCGLGEGQGWSPIQFDSAKFAEHVVQTREIADKCWAAQPDLLPHITTRNTARDMNVIRMALGERKISYYGISYGTYLGVVYTQMFPRSSDRIVLDSNVDRNARGGAWCSSGRSRRNARSTSSPAGPRHATRPTGSAPPFPPCGTRSVSC